MTGPTRWFSRHPLLKSAYKVHKKVRRKLQKLAADTRRVVRRHIQNAASRILRRLQRRAQKSAYDARRRFRRRVQQSVRAVQRTCWRPVQEQVEAVYYRFNVWRWYRQVRRTFGRTDSTFNTYLREQLQETLLKRRLFGRVRYEAIPLVDMLASKYDLAGRSVLCVGCRNDAEIRYFRHRGAGTVVGIDLYQAGAGILIMDMHDLKFGDSTLDVVYSRHSFEHAYDTRRAGLEFVRVLKPGGVVVIEVPGKHQGGGDRNYFTGVDDVLGAFAPHIGEYLWKEYSPKEENHHSFDIIRVMFRVEKPTRQPATS